METINTFCKNQKEVSTLINRVIDEYWNSVISEEKMIGLIKTIVANNEKLVLKEKKFTSAVKQICSKRRLEIVSKIINY